jgi:regulatory protein
MSRLPTNKDPFSRAHNSALRLLSARSRCSQELSDRLAAKGFDQEIVSNVIERLDQAGMIDDLRFAQERARAMGKGKGWGPRKLKRDLSQKGMPQDIVEQAVSQAYGSTSPAMIMKRLIKKRFGDDVLEPDTDLKKKGKAQRYLLGRGFEPDEVNTIFSDPE